MEIVAINVNHNLNHITTKLNVNFHKDQMCKLTSNFGIGYFLTFDPYRKLTLNLILKSLFLLYTLINLLLLFSYFRVHSKKI